MTFLDRSETPRRSCMNQLIIATLLNNLTRSMSSLTADIEQLEANAPVRDLRDPTYPLIARHLRMRRDNISATIASLQGHQGG